MNSTPSYPDRNLPTGPMSSTLATVKTPEYYKTGIPMVHKEDDNRPKTIICDIDGTLFKHNLPAFNTEENSKLELLPGTLEKFSEWDKKGYNIILLTGRRESMRKATESQLAKHHIFYDQLIMGCGGGPRVLINDDKPDGTKAAFVINLERNKGIKDIDI